MQRREFNKILTSSLLSHGLLSSLFLHEAFAKEVKPITDHWSLRLQEYCLDLRKEAISIEDWRRLISELYARIDLQELIRFIDLDNLIKGFEYPDLGVNTKWVRFPQLEGLPAKTAFIKKVFGMKRDRAIIPHGHTNMISAHLILKGEMHLRHYDKLEILDNQMIIQPTIDKSINVGEHSTISDDKDNVHWFVAKSDHAFTFDVIMLDLNGKVYDIHNLDIHEKVDLPDGKMRVPILGVEEALKKYGKETHH